MKKTPLSLVILLLAFIYVSSARRRAAVQEPQDYYKVLGIPKNASEKEIKSAFKKLSAKYHPDKFQNSQEKQKAKEIFMVIANAYEVLINQQTRQVYDQYGSEGVRKKKAQENSQSNNQFLYNQFGGDGGGHQFFQEFFSQ